MTVRKLDANGDIVTSGTQFTSKADEIAQTIRTRLRLFLGEYFRNINEGTPWFQSILNKRGTLSSKDAIIKQRIVRTNGVTELLSYKADYNIDTRVYSVSVIVNTLYGVLPITISEGF